MQRAGITTGRDALRRLGVSALILWSLLGTVGLAQEDAFTPGMAAMHLAQINFYAGPLEPVDSAQLAAALKRFQGLAGLAPTGRLDAATIERLKQIPIPDALQAQYARLAQAPQPAPPTPQAPSEEQVYWQSVEAMNTADAYRLYLQKYPDGRYAAAARKRLSAHEPQPVTVTVRADTPGVTFTPGDQFTAMPGDEVTVMAAKPGYEPVRRTITVGHEDMTIDLGSLARRRVTVRFRAETPGVTYDQPQPAEVPYGGNLTVTASKPGHQSKTLTRREVTADTVLDFGTLEPIVEEVTGLNRNQIRQVQARLQGAGYNPGPVDGLLGGRTRQAVQRFQAARGLPATGQLDAATLEALARLPTPSVTITLRTDTPGVTFSPRQQFTARPGEQVTVTASKQGYTTKSRTVTVGQRDMVVDLGRLEPEQPRLPATLRNSIGMEFVLIPGGEFLMGSNRGDDDERPVHRVRISQPFYLGTYEVTQAEWQAVMGSNPSNFKGGNRPVENVSWHDAQAFIRRLNAREGHTKYRLPTEAEWEYAARAGSTTAYSFGNDASRLGQYAWYGDNSNGQTHPVGQKRSNDWGLYDVHGNVWEWVQDWYADDYYARSPRVDPRGPSSGSSRVFRGGGWIHGAGFCRSAYRGYAEPGFRNVNLGFRLLRTAP